MTDKINEVSFAFMNILAVVVRVAKWNLGLTFGITRTPVQRT